MTQHHYTISLEPFDEALKDCEPLARQHYAEMRSRLAGQGIPIGPYKPRLEAYSRASREGYMFTFIVRTETGEPVGYSNVYLTQSMHNGELYAREDTVFVAPEHRNGIGRRLVKFILQTMKEKGAKRFEIQPVTDLRVGKIWKRMGFRSVSENMVMVF
jgi:GNAT superfamily N-acetyltransferase